MSVLEKYFEHLSPSTITSAHSGSLWQVLLRKCYGMKGSFSVQANRGLAVEHGIVKHILEGMPVDEAIGAATEEFHRLCGFTMPMEKRKKEAANLEPMVRAGVAELVPYGKPSGTQIEILHQHPDLKLPLKGYLDLEYDEHGIVSDIKTKGKAIYEIPTSEARQVSLYTVHRGGANWGGRLTYIWNTQAGGPKALTLELENIKAHYDALIATARNLERFLSLSNDPAELLALSMPNVDDWKMDPASRQKIFEILGI